MTYSIIGRDPQTGDIGLAVQSRYFAAGRVVPFAEAGVGAIASQAFAEPAYGYRGIARLRAGETPEDALEALKAEDAGRERRQGAIMDVAGRVAVHTGAACVAAAGHLIGEHCVAQGNMLDNDRVWPAMLHAFERAIGPLAERLVSALLAAEAEGGDVRGSQAAGLVVVAGETADPPHARRLDLRVDEHADPVGEMARLLAYSRAMDASAAAMAVLQRGEPEAAILALEACLATFPDDPQFHWQRALALLQAGRQDDARVAMSSALALEPRTMSFLSRMIDAGALPFPREALAQLAHIDASA